MSVVRFVQNFSQRRALIASADGRAVEALSTTLGKLGLLVELLGGDRADAPLCGLDGGRDVLFLDGDLQAPPVVPTGPLAELPLLPVVGLVGVEAPSRLRALMLGGATAFLPKPVYGGSVYSVLYLAVNEHARKLALGTAVEELESRRRLRRFVVKAIMMTIAQEGIDDEAAFQSLRRQAMRARLGLEAYCEQLVRDRTGADLDNPAASRSRAAAD